MPMNIVHVRCGSGGAFRFVVTAQEELLQVLRAQEHELEQQRALHDVTTRTNEATRLRIHSLEEKTSLLQHRLNKTLVSLKVCLWCLVCVSRKSNGPCPDCKCSLSLSLSLSFSFLSSLSLSLSCSHTQTHTHTHTHIAIGSEQMERSHRYWQ